jgi:peptidoglycan/LPS O-acetylase OafA/YrhL
VAAVTYLSCHYPAGNFWLGHLWSLSVEEQFYLLWPWMLDLFFRRRLWIIASLIAAGPPLRILLWLLWRHRGIEHPFPAVMDCIAAGCALAMIRPHLQRYSRLFRRRWFLIVPALTALLPLMRMYHSRAYHLVGLTLLHIGIALSIHHVIEMRYRLLNSTPAVWLGKISYSLYLWQQPFLSHASNA